MVRQIIKKKFLHKNKQCSDLQEVFHIILNYD